MYEAEAELDAHHWWFSVRREILRDLLAGLRPALPPGARVLDVGCGTGSAVPALGGPGRTVIGVDAHPLPLSLGGGWASAYAGRLRARLPELPFGSGSF